MVELKLLQYIQKKVMKEVKEYLYVLDYSDSTICEIQLDEEDENLETEDILNRRNLDMDECSFMWTTNKIDTIIELKP